MDKCVLCNSHSGKSYEVANTFGWPVVVANQFPDLNNYDFITIICANSGDEELQHEMEEFLIQLKTKNKKFAICELGNYFGFERDNFGCKLIVQKLLKKLYWEEISNISIDSFPELDIVTTKKWIENLHGLLENN